MPRRARRQPSCRRRIGAGGNNIRQNMRRRRRKGTRARTWASVLIRCILIHFIRLFCKPQRLHDLVVFPDARARNEKQQLTLTSQKGALALVGNDVLQLLLLIKSVRLKLIRKYVMAVLLATRQLTGAQGGDLAWLRLRQGEVRQLHVPWLMSDAVQHVVHLCISLSTSNA